MQNHSDVKLTSTMPSAVGCIAMFLALIGLVALIVVYAVKWYDVAIFNPQYEFSQQLASDPELVNAEVKSDTGSAIILEDSSGHRIVVGNLDTDDPDGVGYDARADAYVQSTGVDKHDKVTVEKRGDFYSNIKVLNDESESSVSGENANDQI